MTLPTDGAEWFEDPAVVDLGANTARATTVAIASIAAATTSQALSKELP
jgi:hypothetical protein